MKVKPEFTAIGHKLSNIALALGDISGRMSGTIYIMVDEYDADTGTYAIKYSRSE
jgi:hypothetical protein